MKSSRKKTDDPVVKSALQAGTDLRTAIQISDDANKVIKAIMLGNNQPFAAAGAGATVTKPRETINETDDPKPQNKIQEVQAKMEEAVNVVMDKVVNEEEQQALRNADALADSLNKFNKLLAPPPAPPIEEPKPTKSMWARLFPCCCNSETDKNEDYKYRAIESP